MSGDTEGVMSVWDTLTAPPDGNEEVLRPMLRFQAHSDCTNGIRYHQSHISTAELLQPVEEFSANLISYFPLRIKETSVKLQWNTFPSNKAVCLNISSHMI